MLWQITKKKTPFISCIQQKRHFINLLNPIFVQIYFFGYDYPNLYLISKKIRMRNELPKEQKIHPLIQNSKIDIKSFLCSRHYAKHQHTLLSKTDIIFIDQQNRLTREQCTLKLEAVTIAKCFRSHENNQPEPLFPYIGFFFFFIKDNCLKSFRDLG